MWTNYRTSPSYVDSDIDEFVQACKRFSTARQSERDQYRQGMEFFNGDEPFMVNDHPATEMSAEELHEALRAPE